LLALVAPRGKIQPRPQVAFYATKTDFFAFAKAMLRSNMGVIEGLAPKDRR
jgi:hypothetical protein